MGCDVTLTTIIMFYNDDSSDHNDNENYYSYHFDIDCNNNYNSQQITI